MKTGSEKWIFVIWLKTLTNGAIYSRFDLNHRWHGRDYYCIVVFLIILQKIELHGNRAPSCWQTTLTILHCVQQISYYLQSPYCKYCHFDGLLTVLINLFIVFVLYYLNIIVRYYFGQVPIHYIIIIWFLYEEISCSN